ncbi:MAG: ABC transporter permease subunit [Clostridiales bacterium]|nr:ABC transporter permease subunit [Clostridiales bacterium]
MLRRRLARQWPLYAMLLLPIIYYVIFCYWPMYGLNIAFKKNIIKNEWVGLYNFIKFLSDPYFYKLLRNTLLLNVYSLAFSFPAPIALALMFNELKNLRFKRVIQSITYLPHFISTVVVCGMVVNFLSNDGFVNQVLASLGFERIQFLMQPGFFRPIYIISGIWQNVGWSSIIYLAAISGVDEELYEAATIDGAGRLRKVLSITLPCIAPTVSIMLIMAIGGIMSVGAEKVLLLYNGATYETADVISTFVYRRGMQGADYSYASAVGMFQSVVGLLFLYAANRFSAKISGSSLW